MFAARQQGSQDIICYVSSLLILQGAIESLLNTFQLALVLLLTF